MKSINDESKYLGYDDAQSQQQFPQELEIQLHKSLESKQNLR